MNSWFGNISVNMKLGLGFGLVLALTCVLALTGWTSLGGLIDRSNWMSDITQLNSGLTKLRVVRLQYMLTNGDETAAQNVQTTLEGFAAQQQKLISSFKSPENVKLLKEQAATIAEYQTSLNKMRNAYRTGNSARDSHERECRDRVQPDRIDQQTRAADGHERAAFRTVPGHHRRQGSVHPRPLRSARLHRHHQRRHRAESRRPTGRRDRQPQATERAFRRHSARCPASAGNRAGQLSQRVDGV